MPAHFDLATPEDDAALRALLRSVPVPGAVTLATTREPSFFAADAALGDHVQTLVARESQGGPPVALAQRAIRTVYLNGVPTRTAYLGGLRVLPEHRGRALVGRGWEALRRLDRADPVRLTTVAITEENTRTRRLLSMSRGAAPRLRPIADLVTLALVVRPRRPRSWPGIAVVPDAGQADSLRATAGPALPLFPLDVRLPGSSRTFVAVRDGVPVGAVTLWDPTSVRQQTVCTYSAGLKRARSALNAFARLAGVRPLPPPGGVLAVAFAAGLVAPDDATFDAILDAALAEARRRSLGFVLVGFDRADPRLARARRRLHLAYPSTLFSACWTDDAPPLADHSLVHAEVATY